MRQLPPVELPNPRDTIVDGGGVAGLAIGGRTIGARAREIAAATDTLAVLTRISNQLETQLDSCEQTGVGVSASLACVRDALGAFAGELEPLALDLPEPLRGVSAIIQQAAREIETTRATATRRLQAATSDEEIRAIEREAIDEARASVQTAVVEIRKAIELIRADEPQVASLYAEQGDAIAVAVQGVEARLTRVVGL